MRKILSIFIIIILVIISAFYISGNRKYEQNTVVFWTLQLGTFDKYINKVINEFEAQNPDIKIKWIDVPYSEGEKRTLASILTDNPPDLVNLTPDFSLTLAQKNALYFIDETDLNNYPQSIISMLKYDGKYFGIPFYATSAITLYNKSFNIKQIPKTYTQLFNISFKSNQNSFLTMINFAENDTLLKLLNKYNINTPSSITSDKSIELFKTFKLLYDENILPKESITQTHRDSLEKYMSGQLAFVVTGANFLNMIQENAPNVYSQTDVLPQLTGETGLYDFSLMNFIIPKRSKNKENALKFALYLTNEQNQLEFAKLTSILPVNKLALEDEYFKTYSDNNLQEKARVISANQLNRLQPPLLNVKNKKELNILSANCIQNILINNADIKQSLEEFSKNWQKL